MGLKSRLIRQGKALLVSCLSGLIRLYQKGVAPCIAPSCRYHPSCSNYFLEALGYFGVVRGSLKGIVRIARCNPFFAGGYDPVITPYVRTKKTRDRLTKGQNE